MWQNILFLKFVISLYFLAWLLKTIRISLEQLFCIINWALLNPGYSSKIAPLTDNSFAVIMDSDGKSCNNVNIVIGSSTTTTREWDIAVTQYSCVDTTLLENTAGPKGCLQYMTGDKDGAGRIDNFGSDITLTTFGASVTHLANQQYNICIR